MQKNLTEGSILKNIVVFSLPYLLSYFLQTLYGMADLFLAVQFNGAAVISAVSIGSQVMHMLTVIIVGLAMGGTVLIGQAIRTGREKPFGLEPPLPLELVQFLPVPFSLFRNRLSAFLPARKLSLLSAFICAGAYLYLRKKGRCGDMPR